MDFIHYKHDYLWGINLPQINCKHLFDECKIVEKFVLDNLKDKEGVYSQDELVTSNKFNLYNIFCFGLTEIQNLFFNLKQAILPCLQNEPYVIQSWVNFYYKNQGIVWHNHWPSKYRAIHGFFCVNTELEESFTEYKFSDNDYIKIISKDGLLVFGKSDGDTHKSSVWNKEIPRVTIAFDILPLTSSNVTFYHTGERPLTNITPFI